MSKVIQINLEDYPQDLNKIKDELPFVFHHSYLKFLIKQRYNCFLFYFKKNIFLPYVTKKNKFIISAYILYPPFTYNGRTSPKDEKDCYNDFINKHLVRLKIDRVLPHIPLDVSSCFPVDADYGKFGNVSLNLANSSEEEIFSGFKASNRNIIRKAKKLNAYVKFGNEVFDDFYTVYKDTLKRQNLFFDSKEYIQRLYSTMINNCLCAVVYNSSKEPQAALLVPFSNYAGYSLYAGSVQKLSIRGAVKYLHWEVILKLKKNNVKSFIFGGVRINKNSNKKYKGLKDFKMSFGGELKEGFLWKKERNITKIQFFEFAIRLKHLMIRKKYLKDIIEQIKEV